jgi:hypothetical protein
LPKRLEKFARAVPGAVVYNGRFFGVDLDRSGTDRFEAQMQAEHVEIAVTGLMQERVGREDGICKDV